MKKCLLSLALATSAVAFSAAGASAAIVCSGSVCWHTTERYEYPSHARVVIHDDNWRWGHREHYSWREHEGRGFWHGRRWEEF
jgi:hypothetical protein